MSNPNDPWSRRPEEHQSGDQPTEGFGAPTEPYGGGSAPTEQHHTADPYQAYGEVPPTQAYPTYEYGTGNQPTEQYGGYQQQGYPQQGYGQGYPPPTNPTMAYGTYEPGQYSGEVPPLEQEPGGPKRNNTGLIVAGLVVVLLAAIAGVAFLLAGSDSDDSSTQASGDAVPTRVLPPSATGRPSPTPPSDSQLPSGLPAIPELGDAFGDFGVAMGTITRIDGSTVEIKDMLGGAVTTIRTDGNTQIVTPDGSEISDLKVGEQVAAQGEKNSDGTFQATVLVSMALPDLGDFGDFGGFGR
ncbi:DUF5666 domain-containing protein [Aldersonia kunmingensis]|uniref:DUF5666 domain-containing protein n=1 Tax=Aldersonia kunmingensis TaxID=408066 RepID=UPI0008377D7C|nr:DUF5666 domain-containing protein [Aldersonia kunmingensis]